MVDRGFGLNTGRDVGLNGQGRQAVPPSDEGEFLAVPDCRDLHQGTVRPFGSGICNVPRLSSDTSFLPGPRITTSIR